MENDPIRMVKAFQERQREIRDETCNRADLAFPGLVDCLAVDVDSQCGLDIQIDGTGAPEATKWGNELGDMDLWIQGMRGRGWSIGGVLDSPQYLYRRVTLKKKGLPPIQCILWIRGTSDKCKAVPTGETTPVLKWECSDTGETAPQPLEG